jgi:hypothetical protein
LRSADTFAAALRRLCQKQFSRGAVVERRHATLHAVSRGFRVLQSLPVGDIDFSCGSRSRGQNRDERAAMTAHAIPTTTRMKRAHSNCMKPPENLSVT